MAIDNILRACLACCLAIGTSILGWAEQRYDLPLLAAAVAIVSWVLTDRLEWFQLSARATNALSFAVLAVMVWQLDLANYDAAILTLANLLAYLQFVLQFRPKTVRNVWLLTATSLLQVSVAAATSAELITGLLLLVYACAGLFTLTPFFLLREQQPFIAREAVAPQEPTGRGRWPLGRQEPFVGKPVGMRGDRALFWDLARRTLGMFVQAIVVMAVVFMLVPRLDQSAWRKASASETSKVVAFTQRVNLADRSKLIESAADVLKVRFVTESTGEVIVLDEAPLLRGSTLSRYERGLWLPSRIPSRAEPLATATTLAGLTRVECVLEPLSMMNLFFVQPPLVASNRHRLRYDRMQSQLSGPPRSVTDPYRYVLHTAAISGRRQAIVTPSAGPPTGPTMDELLQLPVTSGRPSLTGLATLARRIVADLPADDYWMRARAIESHLLHSGEFSYSLTPTERTAGVDPTEDFVLIHRQGHCEFFASATVLMLRSVGIPARMVVGFKGLELNPVTQQYDIQQRHAHAWAEAYIPGDQLDDGLVASLLWQGNPRADGAWLKLDPTPAISADGAAGDDSGWRLWRRSRAYVEALWAEYVLGMNAERQQELFYRPLGERLRDWARSAADLESWGRSFTRIREWFDFSPEGAPKDGWLSWRGATVVASAVVVTVLAYLTLLAASAAWRRWRRGGTTDRTRESKVEFVRRLEALLARRDWVRQRTQTQREFAVSVGGQLAESARTQAAAGLPRRIVEAFYRVRFGGRPLDNLEARGVEQALVDLEQALGTRAGPDRHS